MNGPPGVGVPFFFQKTDCKAPCRDVVLMRLLLVVVLFLSLVFSLSLSMSLGCLCGCRVVVVARCRCGSFGLLLVCLGCFGHPWPLLWCPSGPRGALGGSWACPGGLLGVSGGSLGLFCPPCLLGGAPGRSGWSFWGGQSSPEGSWGSPWGAWGRPWGALGEPWGDLGGAKGHPQRALLQKRRHCKIIGFIA